MFLELSNQFDDWQALGSLLGIDTLGVITAFFTNHAGWWRRWCANRGKVGLSLGDFF